MADETNTEITTLTVQLLSAFVSNNTVSSDGLAELIKTTRAALTEEAAAPAPEPATDYVPAVSVRKSLSSPDHILSLIDGKPYKTLKRHLATHGLTPDQYRDRYKLPKSYPLVAQSYSAARRAVAEKLGLGRKAAAASPAPVKEPAKKGSAKAAPAKAPAAPVFKADVKPAQPKAAAPAKTDARKRLSIAAPKDEKAAAAAKVVPAASATAAPSAKTNKAPKAADKAKPAAKAKAAPKAKAPKSAAKPADSVPAIAATKAPEAAS